MQLMQQPPRGETLVDLRLRHIQLIAENYPSSIPTLGRIRLLNQLTAVKIDLFLFHRNNQEAMRLYDKLAALDTASLSEFDLLQQLLVLLKVG